MNSKSIVIRLILILSFLVTFLIQNNSYAYTGEILKSYKIPGLFPTGLAFDGENLWLADRQAKKIYCINPSNGKVIRSIQTPAYWPTGLAWDGENLWAADVKGGLPLSENYTGLIYKLDRETGTILHTVPAPGNKPRGLAWDGKYLWCADNGSDEIIQFSPEDGTTIRSFKSPSTDPRGLTFDGTYLWVSDRLKDEIYMVDPETGIVLIVTKSPGKYSMGLTYDGKDLWSVDTEDDLLYQLVRNDDDLYVRSNERIAQINYIHEITNFGPGEVLTADVYIAIPVSRANQDITKIEYKTKYTDIVSDASGQASAHYHFENIQAGDHREGQMITSAKIYETRYFIFPDKVGAIDEMPEDVKDKYLGNNEKYQFDHPTIQKALKEAIGNEKNPYWITRNIYQYLLKHMFYEMVGGWNTAPAVLERGNGSCSEYTFVYIAMCRAARIPTRYVGSVVIRGDDVSFDDVFHRWVEVYLPNYGWIPVDPSGGDKDWPRDQANYFGHLANRFLITTENAGGSNTLGWTYNSNAFYTSQPKSFVVNDNFADWKPIK